MRITPHQIIATALVVAAAAIAVPAIADLSIHRPTAVEQLSVPANRTRPEYITADRALGALVQEQSGMPLGNPFALRERGGTVQSPVPQPPSPGLDLPEPPPTPFPPANR